LLKNRDIVCVASLAWTRHHHVSHQMMKRLANSNRVMYLDPPVSPVRIARKPSFAGALLNGHKDLEGGSLLLRQLGLVLPFGYLPRLNLVNQRLVAGRVRRELDAAGMQDVILWFYAPYYYRLVDWIRPAGSCYDCLDDLASLAPGRPALARHTADLEAELVRRMDIVFTTTSALAQDKARLCSRCHVLPPGVDVELYSRALDSSGGIPPDLQRIPYPRLGFVGVVDWRLDWRLLEQLASRRPEWSLVLVGPVEEKPQALANLGNVHFLGARSVEELPSYLRGFQVCLIPFAEGEFSRSANPTKLREYLAAGRPVVSTPLESLSGTDAVVRTARGVDDFEAAVSVALCEQSLADSRERLQWASSYSWDNRVEKAASLLGRLLG
jgi:glycosyltransferase involved in cell wall biosynthesis